jgi:hypothetical protein
VELSLTQRNEHSEAKFAQRLTDHVTSNGTLKAPKSFEFHEKSRFDASGSCLFHDTPLERNLTFSGLFSVAVFVRGE